MRKIIMYIIIALASFLLIMSAFKIGVNSVKPTQIIKEVKTTIPNIPTTTSGTVLEYSDPEIIDAESIDALQKLQTQFNQLQVEYDTFEHYLEGYERGYFLGYMKAKGYEVEE